MKPLRLPLASVAAICFALSLHAQESSPTPSPSPTALPSASVVEVSPTPSSTPNLDEPLMIAVSEGNLADVKKLLKEGASPNATITHPASDYWKKKYFESKLDFYILKETGFTALMLACAEKKNDIVNLLLDSGADPNLKTKLDKQFALQFAARNKEIAMMKRLMKITPDSEVGKSWIKVDLTAQTATLWQDKKLIYTSKISSGRDTKPTPPGEYIVTDKEKAWKSTIFKVPMPYYLRLSCADFGLHAGVVPGHPASHGCIRLPEKDAKAFFEKTPVGTEVTVE
ncbi:MAG: L,D-transpeptidase family protein [Chthoniobacterales bacterium]